MNEIFALAQPGLYGVCCGGGTYQVSEAGTCTCPGYAYRQRCRHVEALRAHLEAARACPLCEHGFIHLRESYPDPQPLPCAACGGTGQREAADPAVLAAAQAERDAYYKALFR